MKRVLSSLGIAAGVLVALSSCALLFGGSTESDGSSNSVIEPPQQLVATVGAAGRGRWPRDRGPRASIQNEFPGWGRGVTQYTLDHGNE